MLNQKRNRLNRRAMLAGWMAAPCALLWLTGCNQETVEVKGGTLVRAAPEQASERSKAAAKAEEEIFKKTKKIR